MYKIFQIFLFIILSWNVLAVDIDSAIKSTVENNLKVKIALEKINESRELIQNAYGSKLPTVTSTISGTYSNTDKTTSTASTTPETFTDNYKITMSKNLYDAGYNDLEIERSKILFDDEIINFKITIQDLILNAIEGYLSVINFEQSLESTKKNYDSVTKALDETKTRYDLGSATLYDLQNAESGFVVATTNLFAAEQNVKISKKSFQRIVGINANNLEDVIEIDTSLNLSNLINNAFNNNLNLLLIQNDIKNKQISVLKEKKLKKPNLDITGTAQYSDSGRLDSGTESTEGSFALTLTVPLFQQGKDNSNIRKYQSQILQAEMNFEDFREELKILILNTYKDFKVSEASMSSNSAVIIATETALDSLRQEYDIGTKTISELVEEEGKLLSSRVDYLNSKKQFILNYYKIKSLEGDLINIFNDYIPTIN